MQEAVAVLVLESFAVERGAAVGAAEEEALGPGIGREPDLVADALEPEHRVVDVERDHRHAVVGVGRAGGDERGHGPGFADAFFQDLTVLGFLVVVVALAIDRLVELALGRVDAELGEHGVHAEGPGLVGNDGDDVFPERLFAEQIADDGDETLRRGAGRDGAAGDLLEALEVEAGDLQFGRADGALGQVAAEGLAARVEILHLRRVLGRPVERHVGDDVVGQGNAEAPTELAKLLFVQLFLLVGDVAAFAGLAHAVALDGLGEDDGGFALGVLRGLEGGVDLERIVPAAVHLGELHVGEMIHHAEQFGIPAKEMLPDVGAGRDGVFLEVAIDSLLHAFEQKTLCVFLEKFVPIGTPDDLDDVPPGAGEDTFEFLDDLAVASDGAVEALEVAVHHPAEVVQLLAAGEGQRAEGFGLVRFAVADEGVDADLVGLRMEIARRHVAQEARVEDRHARPKTHRDGGELPEVRHQIRMRIRAEPTAFGQFLAEVLEMLLGQAAFEEGAGVVAGRDVALEVNLVAGEIVGRRAEEMVVADFVDRGGRGVAGDVAAHADALRVGVGVDDHGHGVPAGVGLDLALQLAVAGILGLLIHRDGVEVGRLRGGRRLHAGLAEALEETVEEAARVFRLLVEQHGFERVLE